MPRDQLLIVIGATGDLTGRLLLPALTRLSIAGDLPQGFRFVGAGPQLWDRSRFRQHARSRLQAHAPDLDPAECELFLNDVDYQQVDVLDPATVGALLDEHAQTGALTLYLALPTHLLAATVMALSLNQAKLTPSCRIAVEKPFGDNLADAVALNAALAGLPAGEQGVFRVDHVLGLSIITDVPSAACAAMGLPLAAWNSAHIEQVSILWEETLALEGRAAFFDGAGALKDLLQNHLLQILCLLTMEQHDPPTRAGWSDDRILALQAVQVPTVEQATFISRRARYTAGRLASTGGANGEVVPDYTAEPGVDPARDTETLAEVTLSVASPRWADTRFVLRAGKAVNHRSRGVLIRFRRLTEAATSSDPGPVRELWIDVDQPAAEPRHSPPHTQVAPTPAPAAPEQGAYANVLRDLLSGSRALSVSAQETERAWQLFTPILQAWTAGTVPMEEYVAGTRYQPAADQTGDLSLT